MVVEFIFLGTWGCHHIT